MRRDTPVSAPHLSRSRNDVRPEAAVFDQVEELVAEHAELERRLADPSLHTDADAARRLGRRYAQIGPVVATYREWRAVSGDLDAATDLSAQDSGFADEVVELKARQEELAERLRLLLVPRDPDDDRDVILEIKAGEGGEESALFAGDLLRMYLRYAERRGWKTEVLDAQESDLGGY
jgi:peptide chain release factor 1